PHFFGKHASSIFLVTPKAANASLAVESNDSPIWNRGNVSRSKRTTECPRWPSEIAADEPAGPPPATAKSKSYRGLAIVIRSLRYHFEKPEEGNFFKAYCERKSVGRSRPY